MKSRFSPVALFLVAVMMSGCSGLPEPVVTTPHTTDAMAFTAAEQTYRNYIDALNHVDLNDPSTFEAVYSWTTGDVETATRESMTQMQSLGWVVSGDATILLVVPHSMGGRDPVTADLAVCVDVGAVSLVDASGASVVAPSRTDVQSTLATLEANAESPTGWLLAEVVGRIGEPTCPSSL
ncbi:hypothetical protein [Microbacterium rhizomatis]|uniref:Uncharacterized protein n=1 Tax=Microbacterium rhizomatis TaxID=1631477 RepID=A0A5J5J4F5_9MICO|nr:hypothetical protein [Microbacterium rhizomatis]KAA9110890.1 hypothetical protein F6B43_04460 [Microbacterium rhizomatis]